MMPQSKFKLYALSASFFIIESVADWLPKINSIILFGSMAQERASKESDVDLFFDSEMNKTQKRRFQTELRKSISSFRLSPQALKFKMDGISNEISPTIGKLDEWASLQHSLSSTGIVLYGKYVNPQSKKGLKHHLLVFWGPKIKNRGSFLNKLYGYNIGNKHYNGLIEKSGGLKAGKSAVIIPVDKKESLYKILEDHEVSYQILEVFI